MILNPNRYRRTLDAMAPAIKDGPLDLEKITLLSIGSHVPLVAVVGYALRPEVRGEVPELRVMFENAISFYQYDAVEPWEDLCK